MSTRDNRNRVVLIGNELIHAHNNVCIHSNLAFTSYNGNVEYDRFNEQ